MENFLHIQLLQLCGFWVRHPVTVQVTSKKLNLITGTHEFPLPYVNYSHPS